MAITVFPQPNTPVMTGATSEDSGASGLVPAPSSENREQYLKGDGTWSTVPQPSDMTGCSDVADGAHGLVPAPSAGDEDKFLRGDGTYGYGGLPMVILSYGHSTWNEFINAYKNHVIVYARASSNSNPATGAQGRMAFMAYTNNGDNPTEVEFQYYRSMNAHTATQFSDQVYVYKLNKTNGWSVTVREASLKDILTGPGLTKTWSSNVATLTGVNFNGATSSTNGTTGFVPAPIAGDEDKYLKGDGTWGTVSTDIPAAPSNDGTYFLQCTVSSGTPSYSWVSVPAASGNSF